MKILCICEMGNVRSVTCARILKARGYEALACSWVRNTPDTLKMLGKWSDLILYLDIPPYLEALEIPSTSHHKHDHTKIKNLEVGMDRWGKAMHPELVDILKGKLDVLDLK